MDLKTDFISAEKRLETRADSRADSQAERRAENDRRSYSERRRTGGLLEVRARRETAGYDRRRGERREQFRSWLAQLGRWRRQA
jgi:hypothetical protein